MTSQPHYRRRLEKRRAILVMALAESSLRRHRRVVVRGSLFCMAAALLIVGLMTLPGMLTRPHRPMPMVRKTEQPSPPPTPAAVQPRRAELVFAHIATDPQIALRLEAPPGKMVIQRINDEQLLNELAEAHQPAGLATIAGRELLLFHHPNGRGD